MTKAVQKLQDLKKKVADTKKEIKETAKTVFAEASAEIFEQFPQLQKFSWTQYTPYWNDGDTCEFGAYTENPTLWLKTEDGKTIKFDDCYGGQYVDDDDIEMEIEDETNEKYAKDVEKIGDKCYKFLSQFDDEDFETMFGDHVEVSVSRNGKVKTDSYEHE